LPIPCRCRAPARPAQDVASSSATRRRACIRRRDGLQSGAARCRESGRAHRRHPSRSRQRDAHGAYDDWRAADRREIIGFTDGLVRLFSATSRPVRHLRNLGLLAFDLLPPAKAALSSLSTGLRAVFPSWRGACLSASLSARPSESANEPRVRRGHRGAGPVGSAMAGLLIARNLVSPGRVAVLAERMSRPARSGRPPQVQRLLGTCGCSL